MSIKDLSALKAKIGGFNVGENSIYSGTKSSINNTEKGIYFDSNGHSYFGDDKNFIRFYQSAEDNKYKLQINADSLTFGSSESVEKAIDNIEIGGRNLLPFETWSEQVGSVYEKENGTFSITSFGNYYSKPYVFGEVGETYTISVDAVTQDSTNARVTLGIYDGSTFTDKQYIRLGETPTNWKTLATRNDINAVILDYTSFSAPFIVKNLKIEKGNKATDWTPAPEDVDAGIANVQADIDTISDKTRSGCIETLSGSGFAQSTKTEDGGTTEVVVYGKSVQDGTPTPEAPVEIKSVTNPWIATSKNGVAFSKEVSCKVSVPVQTGEYFGYKTLYAPAYSQIQLLDVNESHIDWWTAYPEEKERQNTFSKTISRIRLYSTNKNGIPILFRNVTQGESYVYSIIRLTDIILRSTPDSTRDRLFKDSDGLWKIERNCAYISSYNGESITTSYYSNTGELSTGSSVVYALEAPTYETLPDNIQAELNALTTYNPVTNVIVSDEVTPDIDVSFWTRDYRAKNTADSAASAAANAQTTADTAKANAAAAKTAADNAQGTADNVKDQIVSMGEQLIINGNGLMGDNTNFSALIFDASKANGSPGSFTREGTSYTQPVSDTYIPINTNLRYSFEIDAISKNGLIRMYSFLDFYDVDKKSIGSNSYMYIENTLTYLTQDLKNGDTVVHFNDLSGWNDTFTQDYRRGFIFWNYTNSFGYTYPELTYSRNSWYNLYENSNVDKTNNTITLNAPWSHGTFEAGTKLSQCNSGAAYKYQGMG